MRDLSALNIYSMEEFERAKTVMVKTAEACVKEEEKVAELKNVIADLEKNKVEYKNDRLVEKIIARTNCAVNFLVKASGAFSSVTNDVNARRAELEKKRSENATMLEDSKKERRDAIARAKPTEEKPLVVNQEAPKSEKKKPGRPKGKK